MDTISCEQAELLLNFCIDNEPISEHDRQLLDTHIAQCDQCRHQLHQMQLVNNTIKNFVDSIVQKHVSIVELGCLLDNQLESEMEQLRIQAHLQKCEECQNAYQDLKQLNKVQPTFDIKFRSDSFILQWLKWLKQQKGKVDILLPTSRILIPITASIILIVFGYNFYEKWTTPTTLAALADTSPYPYFEIHYRQSLSATDQLMQQSMQDYLKSNYRQTIEKLLVVITQDSSNNSARFYLGACYFIENRLNEAEQQLQLVIQQEPTKARGYWLMAQVYLLKEDKENALEALQKVVELNQIGFSARAERLIETINSFKKF